MPIARLPFLVLGLACGVVASAASPLVPSLHLTAAEAQGDFREEMGSKVGQGLGLSLTIPLTKTLSLRPSLSYQDFPTLNSQYTYKSSRYSDRGQEISHWSAWSYGADCLYHPSGPEGHFYILTGVALKVWKLHGFGTYSSSTTGNPTRNYSVDDTSSKNEPAVAVGLGFTFNRHISFEARSVLASYRSLSYNTVELALVLSY